MSFETWVKANPKLTVSYRNLQSALVRYQESAKKYEHDLEDARGGVIPKKENGILSPLYDIDFADVFYSNFEKNMGWPPISDEKKASDKRQREEEKHQREIEVAITVNKQMVADYQRHTAETSLEMEQFQVSEHVQIEWRNKSISVMRMALCDRLGCLSEFEYVSRYRYSTRDEQSLDLGILITDLEDFIGFGPGSTFSLACDGRWSCKLKINEATFTRTGWLAEIAILRTWLTALDYHWDTLDHVTAESATNEPR